MFHYFKKRSWLTSSNRQQKDYAEQLIADKSKLVKDIKIVSLDLETTGLNAKTDRIVSAAWVMIDHGVINLNATQHHYVKTVTTRQHFDSIAIHGIHPTELSDGIAPEHLIERVIEHTTGAVLLAHNVMSDWRFLNRLCQRFWRKHFICPVIDTLAIERQRLERRQALINPNSLTLAACRKRYGLPEFAEHDPLNDSLATAELFLAQANRLGRLQGLTLKDCGVRLK
ncbi:MAG: exonuclease domain-containing protein [Kangiellaceae bacterium]|jgi:DNA polymerase-3 subunit epsilon|nr:exonuclease domain-containing protein [Kangiellaceae bacterium]